MAETIHLAYGSDDNYWFYTAVSAASAAFGINNADQLVVHLFDIGITDEHYDEFVEIVRRGDSGAQCVRHPLGRDAFGSFGDWKGSVATYARMFLGDLLPDLDWVIYVDGDTLWLGDIAKLWSLRDNRYLILASYDPPPRGGIQSSPEFKWYAERGLSVNPSGYLCMGLMLANLKEMRREGTSSQCRNFMSKYPCPRVVDQTVLNYVCRGRLKMLPREWGVFSLCHGIADLGDHGCVHYVTDVPWKRAKINKLFSDIILLWYVFAENVLGMDLKSRYLSWVNRMWRRLVFVLLKHNQWAVDVHPYLRGHLRNTYGLPTPVLKHWEMVFRRK